jgi:hypothetical protein
MHGYRKGILRGTSMSVEEWMREVEGVEGG